MVHSLAVFEKLIEPLTDLNVWNSQRFENLRVVELSLQCLIDLNLKVFLLIELLDGCADDARLQLRAKHLVQLIIVVQRSHVFAVHVVAGRAEVFEDVHGAAVSVHVREDEHGEVLALERELDLALLLH